MVAFDDLLEKVKEGFRVQSEADVRREADFERRRGEQAELLADAKATEAREEARSQALEKEYQ